MIKRGCLMIARTQYGQMNHPSRCSQHLAFVYVWRKSKEACNLECLVPNAKHGDRSVMIWASIYWYSAGSIITLNGQIM
jgi:hypothetical protein